MRLPMLMLITVAACAGLYFSNSDKPSPQFTYTPQHVVSQGKGTVCAEDERDDAYQVTIRSSTGKVTKASHLQKFYNSGRNSKGQLVWFSDSYVSNHKACSQYTAPRVSQKTYVTLSVWRDGDKTDEVKVPIIPIPY